MSFTTYFRSFIHGTRLTFQHRAFADHTRSRETFSLAIPKNRIKNPYRGGRNIRDRYLALEKSLRGKESLIQSRDNGQQILLGNASTDPALSLASANVSKFRGFVIPTEPSPPESDECCMSGCAVCVYDLYEESLDVYNKSVENLRSNLISSNIPECEWPEHIQTKGKSRLNTQVTKPASVVMNAFEEMERRLKEKHAAQSQATVSGKLGS